MLPVETGEIPAILGKAQLCESIFFWSTDSGAQYVKELRVSNSLSLHFLFPLRSSRKRRKLSRNSPATLRSNSRALKGISGVCNVAGKKHSTAFLHPVSQFFCDLLEITWRMHVIFCVNQSSNA